jgi:hypothetical protein
MDMTLFIHQAQEETTPTSVIVTQVPKSRLSTQADVVCKHTCYELGLSYEELTDPRWCDDRYLNKSCANSNCKHMFVSHITKVVGDDMIAYKPSLKRPLYECLNGKECMHAFCIDCWKANSNKAAAENGHPQRSRRNRNNL